MTMKWIWDCRVSSYLCGTPLRGAGAFFEDDGKWYTNTIHECSVDQFGPFDTLEDAQEAAENWLLRSIPAHSSFDNWLASEANTWGISKND